jgi:hypothetical protein
MIVHVSGIIVRIVVKDGFALFSGRSDGDNAGWTPKSAMPVADADFLGTLRHNRPALERPIR